jgi:hypothetical protein
VHARPRQHDGGEGFVDLEQLDVRHAHAGLVQQPRHGIDGAVEVVPRVGADEHLSKHLGAGPEAFGAGASFRHPQDGGGSVGDLRRVARRVDASLEHGLQPGQCLSRRCPEALVARHDLHLASGAFGTDHGRFDSDDFPFETPLLPCPGGVVLGRKPESVDVGPRDAPQRGDAFGRRELVRHVVRETVRAGGTGGVVDVLPETDAAHRLDPTRQPDLDGVGGNEPGDEVVRLLSRTALVVDGARTHRIRQAGGQPGVPRDVGSLFARLRHASADDESDFARLDAGALDRLELHGTEEVGGVQTGKEAVSLADGRSRRLDDDGRGHGDGSLDTWIRRGYVVRSGRF